jgi:plastocyanin
MLLALLLVLAPIAGTGPAELTGRIELLERDGSIGPAVGAVVWLPQVPATPAAPPTSVASKDKRFQPHVLAVSRGATVVFPNLDAIFHNVFSRTPGNTFDLGLYRKGASKEVRFERPGLVRLFCNIHAQMAAYVMVLDGVAFAVTDETGRYRMGGLPDGRLDVRVWQEKSGEASGVADVAGVTGTFDLRLDASRYTEAPHKNKYGEEYPPATNDADRY